MIIAMIAQPHYFHTKQLVLQHLGRLPHRFIIVDVHDEDNTLLDAPSNVRFIEVPDLGDATLALALEKYAVERICSFSDRGVVPAARLRQSAGLRGNSVETEVIVSDKSGMRERLRCAGLSQVQCRRTTVDRLAADAAGFQPPFIVKPTDASGSLGVELLFGHDQVAGYITRYQANRVTGCSAKDREPTFNSGALMIEDFIEGVEFSVEGVVAQGCPTILGVTNSHTSGAPFFVGLGHDFRPGNGDDFLEAFVQRVVQALEMQTCPFHIEFMKTATGFEVIEAHTRFGGGMLMELIETGTGFSPIADFVELLAGNRMAAPNGVSGLFSLHYIYTDRTGVIADLRLPEKIAASPRILSYALDHQPGDVIDSDIHVLNRIGYVTFTASDDRDAQAFRREIDTGFELRFG